MSKLSGISAGCLARHIFSFSLWPLHVASLGFLTQWWAKGSWTSYMVADGEPVKRPRQKSSFWPSLGSHFCHILLVTLGCPRFNMRGVYARV